jgi:hypothetical protein
VASIVQIFPLLLYLYAIGLGIDFEGEVGVLALPSTAVGLVGLAAVVGWWYACKNYRLFKEDASSREVRNMQVNTLAEPVTALITMPCLLQYGRS